MPTADNTATERIKLVIVEDHEVTLNGLKTGLEHEQDIDVVAVAKDSQEGYAVARMARPDVILLDLHLPGAVGPKSLVRTFCGLPARLLVLSADSRLAVVQSVLQMGARGYILKSEPLNVIAQAVRKVYSGDRFVISKEVRSRIILTAGERELLMLLARGMKYAAMANYRGTLPNTIRKQCDYLQDKLQLSSREELIAWAVENGYSEIELEKG